MHSMTGPSGNCCRSTLTSLSAWPSFRVAESENDGQVLLSMLALCRSQQELLVTMAQIQGPWAFVYWQSSGQRLWFGRDVLGRRSLLYHLSSDTGQLSLASVCLDPLKPWFEVPAAGIYCVDFSDACVSTCNDVLHEIMCYPWVKPPGQTCALASGTSKGRVVDASDAVPFCEATKGLEQRWGGVPVRGAQLGVVAPLGSFNTTLPDGPDEISVTTASSDQSVDGVVSAVSEVDISGHEGRSTRGCMGSEVVSDSSRSAGDWTCPSSLDTQARSAPQQQCVTTSGANIDSSPCPDRTETITTPSDSHVTKVQANGATVPLLKWATERQWELSQKLLHVLMEAVRVRVQLQASRCHHCLAQDLHENCESETVLDAVSSINVSDTPPMTKSTLISGSFVPIDSDSSQSDSTPLSTEQLQGDGNHGNHPHDNTGGYTGVAKATDPTKSIASRCIPSVHQPTLPRETNYVTNQFYSHCNSYQDVHCSHGNSDQDVHHGHDNSDQDVQCGYGNSDQAIHCGHARVAVLFSGGIDSLVLAALADRHTAHGEPIDLLNVAFERQQPQISSHKRNQKNRQVVSSERFDVPDRITGRQGLGQLNSARTWNFVEVDVTLQELQEARSNHVRHLIYPLETILDDSIGCAIWFAARGRGLVTTATGKRMEYVSTARVVLVGMGADEQLAGYSRHRMKFQNSGWEGLIQEVQMEIGRISTRNLGRDDRVISDHAREARFPFLDENVVSFLHSLPLHEKANLSLQRGIGEKLLLRLLALRLGLAQSATLPKRAIQFGSRIAKMENRKEHASNTCDRLRENQSHS